MVAQMPSSSSSSRRSNGGSNKLGQRLLSLAKLRPNAGRRRRQPELERQDSYTNSSARSTMSRDEDLMSKELLTAPPALERPSQVKFAMDQTVVHEIEDYNEVPVDELWFDRDLFKQNKQQLCATVTSLVKDFPDYQAVLRHTFVACRQVTFETKFCVLSHDEERALLQVLSQHADVCLGLEEASLGRRSHDRRQQLLEAVERYQHMDDPERLRRACETLSRPCRLFFQHLGQAHAELLHWES